MSEIDRVTTSPFDAIRRQDDRGEHWTGRDVMPLMQYGRWHEFAAVIEKAKASLALVQGKAQADHHFVIQHSDGGRWGTSRIEDYRLTRFGAYLTAMAGDDTKKAIAEARIYFAVKTGEAEAAAAAPTQRRELTNRELALMVIEEADRADRAEAALEAAAPKAAAWTKLASAHGDYSVADAAKILSRDPDIKLGERRLFTLLGELGWIFRASDGRWRIYQTALKCKRLSELPSSHYHPRTGELQLDAPQVRVTVKGIEDLRAILVSKLPQRQLAIEVTP